MAQWVKPLPAMPASQPESQLLCSLQMLLGRQRKRAKHLALAPTWSFWLLALAIAAIWGNK